MTKKALENIININEISKTNFETYKEEAIKNMIYIFNLNSEIKSTSLKVFLENLDHGALHTYSVFKKSLEISEEIEKETGAKVDKILLYIMSGMHDSGRFRIPMITEKDTEKQIQAKKNKQIKSERNHNNYGVTQIKLGIKKLKEKNIEISKEDQEKIEDYILNHDFFNNRLDGIKYTEPKSLEGQITRLSDRISIPIEEEIGRYRETGKRLNTTYFKSDISFEERIEFNFDNMGKYIKSGKFDEFTFFLSLLSQNAEDFSHPILSKIYQKWACNKKKGIKKIIEIAKEEGYSNSEIKSMEYLINKYINHFGIIF